MRHIKQLSHCIEVTNKKKSETKTTTIEKKKVEDEPYTIDGNICEGSNYLQCGYSKTDPSITTIDVVSKSDFNTIVDGFERYKKRCIKIQKANKWKSAIKSRRRYH